MARGAIFSVHFFGTRASKCVKFPVAGASGTHGGVVRDTSSFAVTTDGTVDAFLAWSTESIESALAAASLTGWCGVWSWVAVMTTVMV